MHSYQGYCRSQLDCLILFEAACMGLIPRISQRLTEDERSEIKSGSIYIWDENEAGVKRWTDGKSWSTSRVSGPFLIYRELEAGNSQSSSRCQVKPYGLCKQSASITVGDNTKLHLIAYYKKEDVRAGSLMQPSMDLRFKDITAFLKKRNVALVTPEVTTPPLSPPAYMQTVKPAVTMHQVHTQAYPVMHMYSPAQHTSMSSTQHPHMQRLHTPGPQQHMPYATMAPPSPPYSGREDSPPLMTPMTQPPVPHMPPSPPMTFHPLHPHAVTNSDFKHQSQTRRSFDEDRRQLSLLDRSLSTY